MIVLTGSIATGKSSVCKLMHKYGWEIVDADKIAKNLINAKIIKSLFGQAFVKNGRVDRKALGNLIFSDERQRKKLNKYIHPLVRQEIKTQVTKFKKEDKKFIVDIPLYFESGNYDASRVVVVYCPRRLQLKRLMKREGISGGEAIKRVNSQIDIEEKKLKADIVIDNSRDMKYLAKQVKKLWSN
ncbi:MAG: dephospho-CoA kinase [Campylobacteraceae bacterium]|nr:dephospho-CoA kinase [Campylobacteraceae bacterium]